jgi:acetyl/propionyl-CoA carboxylase alpha subunit
MNTRLQVEHRVTELVTGIDLVREQLLVAGGRSLSVRQDEIECRGAAIEARICAEEPEADFRPAVGQILDFVPPEGVIVDSGIETGTRVGAHYDSMLAKIVASAPDREIARGRLDHALSRAVILGVNTNIMFLRRILQQDEFIRGKHDTSFIGRHRDRLCVTEIDPEAICLFSIGIALCGHERRRPHLPVPSSRTGFRNNRFRDQEIEYWVGAVRVRVSYRHLGESKFLVRASADGALGFDGSVILECFERLDEVRSLVVLEIGRRITLRIAQDGGLSWAHRRSSGTCTAEEVVTDSRKSEPAEGACVAPLPGTVVKVAVQAGQEVRRGEVLVVLEAMKMEHAVTAASGVTVDQVCVALGDQVKAGDLLVRTSTEDLVPRTS